MQSHIFTLDDDTRTEDNCWEIGSISKYRSRANIERTITRCQRKVFNNYFSSSTKKVN